MTDNAAAKPLPVVLVVDDEDDQRELLRAFLVRDGYRVLTAQSGADALALAQAVEPSLIFLDLLIPDIDGWHLTEELNSLFPSCPVVITSVLDPDRYPPSAGALPKPFSRKQVQAVLRTHLPMDGAE